VVNILAWVAIHLGLGYLCSRIPITAFNPSVFFFQSFAWEREGFIYKKIFKVQSWKHLIPQGSRIYKGSFSLQHLNKNTPTYLMTCIQESIRAEFCHWVMIIPGFFFTLWNDPTTETWIMVYGVVVNIIPIILQRYNRPRFRALLEKILAKQQVLLPLSN
jgi:glycosyl-4,4'-diaponeurosporenoate acyltransferase